MRFRSTVELGGKTARGFAVPEQVVLGLGGTKRPPVRVTVNGYSYRSTVAPMGGRFMLPLSATHREAAGVAAGDEVDVDLELDTEPRVVPVPVDLAEAMAHDPAAARCFAGLSYSRQQRLVLPIDQAKTAETRRRRIEKAVALLREGRA